MASKKVSTPMLKTILLIIIVTAMTLGLLVAVVTTKQWVSFKKYRTVAAELNTTLGGGYKTTYNWQCGLETTNCPSVHMYKDENIEDDLSVALKLKELTNKLDPTKFTIKSTGECSSKDNFGYCKTEIKDTNSELMVVISVRPKLIFVDIQP